MGRGCLQRRREAAAAAAAASEQGVPRPDRGAWGFRMFLTDMWGSPGELRQLLEPASLRAARRERRKGVLETVNCYSLAAKCAAALQTPAAAVKPPMRVLWLLGRALGAPECPARCTIALPPSCTTVHSALSSWVCP